MGSIIISEVKFIYAKVNILYFSAIACQWIFESYSKINLVSNLHTYGIHNSKENLMFQIIIVIIKQTSCGSNFNYKYTKSWLFLLNKHFQSWILLLNILGN